MQGLTSFGVACPDPVSYLSSGDLVTDSQYIRPRKAINRTPE